MKSKKRGNDKPEPNKVCPLFMAGSLANSSDATMGNIDCIEDGCSWWIDGAYTTEGIYDRCGRCAIVMMALKNSDGKIPV